MIASLGRLAATLAVAVSVALLPTRYARAETADAYPSKPITIIVHFGAGGPTDLPPRHLATILEKKFRQPVVVENRTGGGGVIGLAAVAKARPDGYTLGTISSGPSVIAPHLRAVPFDTSKDFTYVAQIGEFTQLLCVLPSKPWMSVAEMVDFARANPGALTYSTVGAGSGAHVFMESLARQEKVKFAHVPFVGGAQGIAALLGGHVTASLDAALSKHAQSGECRALAAVGRERHPAVPNVPTFAELGYPVGAPMWLGLMAPAGLPEPIVRKLSDAFLEAAQDPAYKALLASLLLGDVQADYKAFGATVRDDYGRMEGVLRELGVAARK